MRRLACILMILILLLSCFTVSAEENPGEKKLKLLFTHDMHSFYGNARSLYDGEVHEHGGIARLKTLLDENTDESTIYVDSGDFSIGTMLQAGFTTDAYELRLLGSVGCAVTTFGNHEFDYTANGTADMLLAALDSGDPLPEIVQSNVDFSGDLSDTEKAFRDANEAYGIKPYTIKDVNGIKVGFFGLIGLDAISCAPTSGLRFENYIDSAKRVVPQMIADGAEVIVCLSHSGTTDAANGEDIELAKAVPDIDVIVSGHTHSTFTEPAVVGNTIIASVGEYLTNLGSLTLSVSDGKVALSDYKLIRCDENVAEDPELAAKYDSFKESICETYLTDTDLGYDDFLVHCGFNFTTLNDMYATHDEFPMINLIADSYRYEAEQNGINDIDVTLVGLGTVRGSFFEGDIRVSDAFEVCSLGVGSDGSANHPLIAAYITGKELKLLVELDASLGPLVSTIKMGYSGIKYQFNTKRALLDRVTDICLVRKDGSEEEIEDGKLYKVCCNLYSANMLGMLNGLTKGILKIVPKYEDGTPVADFYDCALLNTSGKEIKEWVAFRDFLASFEDHEIPAEYAGPMRRKVKVSEGGFAAIANPGATTICMMAAGILVIGVVIVLIATRKQRKMKRLRKKELRAKKTK